MEPMTAALIGFTLLLSLGLTCVAVLKGWQAWLDYKRLELASHAGDHGLAPATGRIELADLKERVRKLEAIANGIDL